MKIYVASRVRHAKMWQAARAGGAPINSTWIDEAGDGETGDFGELWQRIQREVSSADRLVFFAEKGDFPFKGALVEVGIALQAGLPIHLVLDPEIELEGRTMRPLGSWAKHPSVKWMPTLYDALREAA